MEIIGVRNNNDYQEPIKKTDAKQNVFALEESEESIDKSQERCGEVPEKFVGMSFMDLMGNSEIKKNQIPVVNQIVSSKNPEDGEIYLTYFTDEKILCNHADGRKAWEISINCAEQSEKIQDFFKGYSPYEWAKELYSGDNMGMVTLKNFWLELFDERT